MYILVGTDILCRTIGNFGMRDCGLKMHVRGMSFVSLQWRSFYGIFPEIEPIVGIYSKMLPIFKAMNVRNGYET
jgi:hypothetical protein